MDFSFNLKVSQLHKCAFQIKDTQRVYLCLSQDRIIQFQSQECPKDPLTREMINDGACWTIISTDKAEYSWSEGMGPVQEPVTPIPVVSSIRVFFRAFLIIHIISSTLLRLNSCFFKMNANSELVMIDLIGVDLKSDLTVWFGDIEVVSYWRSHDSILCRVPDVSLYKATNSLFSPAKGANLSQIEVPIILVRKDGIIYNTGLTFTYNPEPAQPIQQHLSGINKSISMQCEMN